MGFSDEKSEHREGRSIDASWRRDPGLRRMMAFGDCWRYSTVADMSSALGGGGWDQKGEGALCRRKDLGEGKHGSEDPWTQDRVRQIHVKL